MTLILSPQRQRLLALVLAVVALAGLWFLVAAPVWASIDIHQERVSMLRRQVQTLEALAAAAPKYDALARKVSANPEVRALTFVAAQPSVAVADLQAELNRIFTSAGAVVSTSQALPDIAEGGVEKIAVQTTIEVKIAALVDALHAIGVARPLLKIEKLAVKEPDGEWVNPSGANVANTLIVDLVVSAHLRRP
ncbi:MAG: type II secretion system protein M [Alphaproteobacteria bacterium]|nr:type II secretion system protein M [Alphaproteobacteria bacterium]